MSQSTWVTLVGDVDPPTSTSESSSIVLARLAGRGGVSFAWSRADSDTSLRPWQRGMLASLQVRETGFASAPISVLGHGHCDTGAIWLHAEPVHFAAGLDRLSFLGLHGEARVTAEERAALFDTLHREFSSGDLTVHALGNDWFVRSGVPLQIATSPPDAAAANELRSVMPRGKGAAVLHRTMTELQMVLHDHPVNERRSRTGAPAINSIWLWGAGSQTEMPSPASLPLAFGGDAFLWGLYRLIDRKPNPLPANATDLLPQIEKQDRALIVATGREFSALEALWIEPLVASLRSGAIERLDLILGEWHVEATRGAMRRFWRKASPPSRWERRK